MAGPIGALYRHHSLNHDTRKADLFTMANRDTVHKIVLERSNMILCNKSDFSFGAKWSVFAETVTYDTETNTSLLTDKILQYFL